MKLRGDHVVIRKEKGRPVGHDHINGIEGFGSYAKNWLYPYRSVPSKYSHLSGQGLLSLQPPQRTCKPAIQAPARYSDLQTPFISGPEVRGITK